MSFCLLNRHYEKIGSEMNEIDIELEFPRSWQIVRLGDVCRLIDGEKKSGSYPCLDAKFLRGKATATILNSGKYTNIISSGEKAVWPDGRRLGDDGFLLRGADAVDGDRNAP